MAKALLSVGYYVYVLNPRDAASVAAVLSEAPLYERKGYGENATMHCYPQEPDTRVSVEVVSDETIALAKLAGKPVKKS